MKLEINKNNMLRVLKNTFSKSTDLFTELLQNSRRAGATLVTVTIQGDTIVFEDNGEGISDFQKLLTLGDSGYSVEVIAEEKPFGLGFLAALFRANMITVQSGKNRLIIDTKKILNDGNAVVNQVIDEGIYGTKITLKFEDESEVEKLIPMRSIGKMLKHFPVTVVVNGTTHKATNIDHKYMVDTVIGKVNTALLHGKDPVIIDDNLELYYQYLPIKADSGNIREITWKHRHVYSSLSYRESLPVYLNNDVQVRMPERDYLLDPKSIQDRALVIWNIVLDVMEKDLKTYTDREFVLKWYNFILTHRGIPESSYDECRQLFNNIPIITGLLLKKPTLELPTAESYWDYEAELLEHELYTKEDLKDVVIISEIHERDDRISNLDLVLASELNGMLASTHTLHCDHWLHDMVTEITQKDIDTIHTTNVADGAVFSAEHYMLDVSIAKNVSMQFADRTVDLSGYVIVTDEFLILPKDALNYVEDTTLFISNCYDEYDTYQESIFEYLTKQLNDIIQKISANSMIEYYMEKVKNYSIKLHPGITVEVVDESLVIKFNKVDHE